MSQIIPYFSVPFCFAQHPQPDALNATLRALFLARETEGDRFANPNPYTMRNVQLFESHFDLFHWPEPCIAELSAFCLSNLMRWVSELNGYDAAALRKIDIATDAWFHVTRRNGYFGVHNHPMASWSGVYCVSPGVNDADQPNSGGLMFINPNTSGSMYADPGNGFLRKPYQHGNPVFHLVPGQLVVFPSWIMHHVVPFYGDGERITVAFNCSFRQR